jgi:predicted regulator of Ras-like GTPase activity (Roadblock/LC7/MglB family)
MNVLQALSDLTEISSQIEAALILDADGSTMAATLDDTRGLDLARAANELLAAARRATGKEPAQLEVSTVAGSVFIVRDGERAIVATTGPEPTVGLVFYDLKSCLRSVAAEEKPKPKPKPKPKAKRAPRKTESEADAPA